MAPGHLICVYTELGLHGEKKMYEGEKGKTDAGSDCDNTACGGIDSAVSLSSPSQLSPHLGSLQG